MIGSSVWGSNNHLSGSTVRDMNSGGSMLCSNMTFRWCSTTSDERPSSLASNENIITDHTYDGNKGNDSDTRLNITTDTTFMNCIFQHLNYTTVESNDGGATTSVVGGCILLMGSYENRLQSTLTVSSCSFDDWYPRKSKSIRQSGGGIGTFSSSAPLSIVESNFTLSGVNSIQPNGGFLSIQYLEDTSSSVTISNCRIQGDGNASDSCLYFRYCDCGSGGFTISDTEIVNISYSSVISNITGVQPIVVTQSNLVHGSLLVKYGVVSTLDPLLIVDCTLDGFSITLSKSNSDFYFVGTTFHTSSVSSSTTFLSFKCPCFVIFQGCLFDGCETSRDGMISCSTSVSLTLDTCAMSKCKTKDSISSLFDLSSSTFKAYSCTFAAITGVYSTVLAIKKNGSVLMENCRFDLEPSTKADFRFDKASPSLLNTSSIIGCTSNRVIRVTTDGKTLTTCSLFEVCPLPHPKSEIELVAETDQDGKPIETTNTLWPEIQQLEENSSTIISLSDGWFTESSHLSIKTDIEIVGNGTESVHLTFEESPRPHTTKLKAVLNVKAGANLTVRSMTLLPTSFSSAFIAMSEEGNLTVKTIVVSSSALIVVSGTGSLFLSDTLFLTISRTLTIDVNGSVQSGSCVDGLTSGSISIQFCKFGACSSNGRAGAIDVVSNGSKSRVEMEGCQFDMNKAESEMNEAEKGDDVVLKDFSDEQLTLNFTAIESFPSIIPFLINSDHTHVPPPHTLHFSPTGFNTPLAWSPPYTLHETRLSELTLQSLLDSRLHNNVHTSIITDFEFNETMKPFILENASACVTLVHKSRITVTQPTKEIFGTLLNASLGLETLSQRGGVAFCHSCNVTVKECEFSSCSAQHGGVIFLELESCRATAKDNGVAVGRGGAICVNGATAAETPISLTGCSFEKNTAAFGNDVFVEKSVLDDKGPDRLKGCKGESRSDWPHLEIEGITKEENESEWTRISTFIDFPTIHVLYSGTDDTKCRFSNTFCRTLPHAFQYLNETFPNGTPYPHSAILSESFIFQPMILENVNMMLGGNPRVELKSTIAAGSSMFTVKGGSRLTISSFEFVHKANHTIVSVTSSEGWLEMRSCDVTVKSGTFSHTSFIHKPACFIPTHPITRWRTRISLFVIVIETSGDLIFQTNNFTKIQSDLVTGQYVSMKGHNFKQQVIPEEWEKSYSPNDLATLCGEDTSLAQDHKWRRGSLVLSSGGLSTGAKISATISTDFSDSQKSWAPWAQCLTPANCGSSEFQCSTLDSALESASLNSLKVITLSSPSSLERGMTVAGTRTVRSSNSTQREVTVSLRSSVTVAGGDLSFLTIRFASDNVSAYSNGENTRSASLFVVGSGSLSLTSCSLSSFTLNSYPLISHTVGSLSLDTSHAEFLIRHTPLFLPFVLSEKSEIRRKR
ncbi:hypothetical protein BLNAU_21241 [Blattamonas nauphoetae]|uniref:Uncharacterized protein n=1 Tax=Blattamonas nauphoetae TaxID=2049346 RepID=A0ABQ9WWF6_9EUKA|nr:hypothetical protein BLNAU_21241 [Blattamonas nauphoetae]